MERINTVGKWRHSEWARGGGRGPGGDIGWRKKLERTQSGERVNERESVNCVHCAGLYCQVRPSRCGPLTPPAARRHLSQLSDRCIPMQLGHSKACLKLHPHCIEPWIALAPVGPLHCNKEGYSVPLWGPGWRDHPWEQKKGRITSFSVPFTRFFIFLF